MSPGMYPTTGAQAGLWLADQRLGPGCAYHVVLAFTLEGRVDLQRVEAAWRGLVDQIAPLQLRMGLDEQGRVGQWFAPVSGRVWWSDVRVSSPDDLDLDPVLGRWVREPFDPDGGELCRMAAAPTVDGHTAVVLVAHHLLCDGISQTVLADRFVECVLQGTVRSAPAQRYLELVRHVREAEEGCLRREGERWAMRVTHRLAGDRWWPSETSEHGPGHVRLHVDAATTNRLRGLARRVGGSLFLVLVGAVHRALAVLGCDRTVTSVAASVRPPDGAYDDVVGHFVNQVPLLASHRPGGSLPDLVSQEVPGWREDLTTRTLPPLALSEHATLAPLMADLHRVMVSERRSPATPVRRYAGGDVGPITVSLFTRSYQCRSDLMVRFIRRGDDIEYDVDWSSALPPEISVHFVRVLSDVLAEA